MDAGTASAASPARSGPQPIVAGRRAAGTRDWIAARRAAVRISGAVCRTGSRPRSARPRRCAATERGEPVRRAARKGRILLAARPRSAGGSGRDVGRPGRGRSIGAVVRVSDRSKREVANADAFGPDAVGTPLADLLGMPHLEAARQIDPSPPPGGGRAGAFTTGESGTGLGIMLARGVLAQHAGSLAYESTLGAGTTAVATLPISLMERTDPRVEAPARGR